MQSFSFFVQAAETKGSAQHTNKNRQTRQVPSTRLYIKILQQNLNGNFFFLCFYVGCDVFRTPQLTVWRNGKHDDDNTKKKPHAGDLGATIVFGFTIWPLN